MFNNILDSIRNAWTMRKGTALAIAQYRFWISGLHVYSLNSTRYIVIKSCLLCDVVDLLLICASRYYARRISSSVRISFNSHALYITPGDCQQLPNDQDQEDERAARLHRPPGRSDHVPGNAVQCWVGRWYRSVQKTLLYTLHITVQWNAVKYETC